MAILTLMGRKAFVSLWLLSLACQGRAPRTGVNSNTPTSNAPSVLVASNEPIALTIVGDNDIHGALDAHARTLTFTNGQARKLEVGGAEIMAAFFQRERAMNPAGVVLVSAGDFFQGTLIANQFQGAAVIDVLNDLKYDAVAIGNHEFDYGPLRTDSQRNPNDTNPRGALIARMRQGHFPFLSCNIIDNATQQPPNWPHLACATLTTRKGVKIGLIGATTADTPRSTLPDFVRGLSFLPVVEGLRRGINEASSLGADIIVAIVHAGTDCKRLDNPQDNTSCDMQDELPVALRALGSATLDLVVAGHTHGHVAQFIEGVPVIESGAQGLEFGRVTLYVDAKTHRVIKDRTQISQPQEYCHEVISGTQRCDAAAASAAAEANVSPAQYLGAPMQPDQHISKLLSDYRQAVRIDQARVITRIENPIQRTPFGESGLGDLITDCMLAGTRRDPQIPDAEFAIQNSGGLRQDILAGVLTFGALYEVLPFENVLVTVSLTGAQIRQIFELALAANSKVFQVSGLRVTYSAANRPGSTSTDVLDPSTHDYRVARVDLLDGKPLMSNRKYTVVWNDFLAAGGDGMAALVKTLAAGAQTYHYATSPRKAVEDTLKATPSILAVKRQQPSRGRPRVVFEFAKPR